MIGPLAYIGGKRRIAKQLVALFPPHITYVEPFAGGAQVFFHKARSKVEVLNDIDQEISNLFRVLQRHPAELSRLLRWQPASRRLFENHQAQPRHLLTDIERAARFFYLQKNAWGGHRTRQHFHYAIAKRSNYKPAEIERQLRSAAERLASVQLESLPYQDILKRYDRTETFFYCDPPYVDLNLYAHNFDDAQFVQLADRLAGLKGRFLLSINDCPKSRQWFGRFYCTSIALTYTSMRTPKRFSELLFANYALTPASEVEGAGQRVEGAGNVD